MSNNENFDFDISSILGGFTEGSGTNEPNFLNTDDLAKELEEDVKKEEEDEESSPEEIEEIEDSTEDVESEDPIEEGDEEELEESEYSFKGLANYLAEEGIVDFEDSDDLEDSPDLIKNVVFNTAKNMVDEYKESIPEIGKQFLKYIESGGDPHKFVETVSTPLDFNNVDLSSQETQKQVIAEFLKTQDYTAEEIEEEISDYEDGLLLEKKSATALNKLKTIYGKKSEELIKQQEEAKEQQSKEINEYLDSIKTTIHSSESLGGLKVNGADKKEFEKYILHRGSDGMTQYEKDIQENPIKTQVELAYLKYKKFDFSKMANKVKTEEAKRLKGIFKTKDTTIKGSSGVPGNNNDGSLDGFTSLPIFG